MSEARALVIREIRQKFVLNRTNNEKKSPKELVGTPFLGRTISLRCGFPLKPSVGHPPMLFETVFLTSPVIAVQPIIAKPGTPATLLPAAADEVREFM
ncbi:MAG: hypothetical protein C6W57_13500 [Caldibacillus debilis]|nr:MAG: hypothetical protein C6W57_13500 [Caldibacillus debilis]